MHSASSPQQYESQYEESNKCGDTCDFRCDYVDFDVAVFTNIVRDKVDAFGGITQYLDAQGSLFMKLQDPNRQRAVVNTDGALFIFETLRLQKH